MDGGSNSSSFPSMDSPVLDVKPLRCLAPMFPSPFGYNAYASPNSSSNPPFGGQPFTPIFTPVFPNFTPQNGGPGGEEPSPDSKSPVKETAAADEGRSKSSRSRRASRRQAATGKGSDAEQFPHPSSATWTPSGVEESDAKTRRRRPTKKVPCADVTVVNYVEDGDRESVERIMMIFDGLRRGILQIDDAKGAVSGATRRPDLKAGAIMSTNVYRTNSKRRIGAVPGVDIGDLFYFRFEMCLVGLHSPSMAGIDYLSVKFEQEEEPVALSIVSSGGYEDDDMHDTDVLIYTGQGGATKLGKQGGDQKLERGNLALENSSRRGNEIRVIRGMKDPAGSPNKIYVYDGLYKVQESWTEKGKSGFSVFKYKLLRMRGQPEGSAIWKRTREWKDNPSCRGFVILTDLSSGVENMPVCLVNEVDKEKGPAHFSYVTAVKCSQTANSPKPSVKCNCYNTCPPGDASCQCWKQNGGSPPYSSSGILANRRLLVYECGPLCTCSVNCRNRVTQKGTKLQFEVFKTRDRGWGLRSWDPIRAGLFICEYTGEVVDQLKQENEHGDNEYLFEAFTIGDENFTDWNCKHELLGQKKQSELSEVSRSLSITINAKHMGNVSRFMNHSCSPNTFWQPVLYDHNDDKFPHIMFFALKHIPPMTELTYDYGMREPQFGKYNRRKKCLCGSSKCRGFFV